MTSLNAARKRRAGLADTGRCLKCGRYRMFCNGATGCLDDQQPERVTVEKRPFPNGRPSWYTRIRGDER